MAESTCDHGGSHGYRELVGLFPSDSDSRVELLCDLFSRCTHREQVVVLEQLPEYLKRDFVSLLPPELVMKILCYLDPMDVLGCLLVSRRWNEVINDCRPYWKFLCSRVGIPQFMRVETEHRTLKGFALTAMKLRNRIKKAKPKFTYFTQGFESINVITVQAAEPITGGAFIGHVIHPNEARTAVEKHVLSIKVVDSDGVFSNVANVTVAQLFVLIWGFASSTFILVYGSTGEWIRCKLPPTKKRRSSAHMWMDQEICSMAFYEIGSCPDCSLVGVIPKKPRDNSLWNFGITKLIVGQSDVGKVKCPFSFMPYEELKGNPYFEAHKIALLPHSGGTDQHGFCNNHRVLFQFGACIVLFTLHSESNGSCHISAPLQSFCPEDNQSLFASAYIMGHKFCLSADNKILGYFVDGYFYRWNVETYESSRSLRRTFPGNARCLAVGHLYSMMLSSQTVRVFSSITGESVLNYGIRYSGESPNRPIYGPVHQEWLNTLELPSSIPKCELIVTISQWLSPAALFFKAPHVCVPEEKES